MITYLPQEILALVVEHVYALSEKESQVKLTDYTLVNKYWQAAFERQIWSSVTLLSTSGIEVVTSRSGKQYKKRGLHFADLEKLTSGPESWQLARRDLLRDICYRVAVPRFLDDGDGDEDEEADINDDVFRRENDLAFTKGMSQLFNHLSTWTKQKRTLSLSIVLQAEKGNLDNEECEIDEAIDCRSLPYRAELPEDCHLSTVQFVASLSFPTRFEDNNNGISLSAALRIAASCGGQALERLEMGGNYGFRPEQCDMQCQMRDSVSQNLARLPASLRVLEFDWDWPPDPSGYCQDETPPPIKTQVDALSASLRGTLSHLQRLCVEGMEVSTELFFHLQSTAQPSSLSWQHLEVLELCAIPWFTPSGHGLNYYNTESFEQVFATSYFDELFTCIGHAALKMPRIKQLLLIYESNCEGLGEIELHLGVQHGQAQPKFHSENGYIPLSEVLRAWQVPQDRLEDCGNGWSGFDYDTWLPE
ncbi:hypothetical protein D6D27_06373 [Aureobasidium pullulans]|nr:hypothetical protein D6D27_06373 [Aureobasidium pullulans]